MEIKSQFKGRDGQMYEYVYREGFDPLEGLDGKILQAVHGFCFCGDKLVVVYAQDKGYWTFPGGGIEKGETYEEAVVREVKEESNMKVLHQELIGYIDVYEKDRTIRQTRSFCIVEPYGDFVSDPDGDISEIKLIDPKEYDQYVKWGEIGDHIVKRAIEMKNKM
ncbi:MAG: NUDIX hydrolase [bacterium]